MVGTMDELDAINRELGEVVDALNATPDDDFARRHELHKRQDELRELAAKFWVDADAQRPIEDLARELTALEAQRDSIMESGIDLVTQAGGGSQTGGSYTSAGEAALSRGVKEAAGLGNIESRISKLRQLLEARAADS